jgi:hypothetical protein
MPSDQCIELCKEIVDNKNKALLENFGGGNLFECEVVLDDYNADSNIPEQLLCDEKTE